MTSAGGDGRLPKKMRAVVHKAAELEGGTTRHGEQRHPTGSVTPLTSLPTHATPIILGGRDRTPPAPPWGCVVATTRLREARFATVTSRASRGGTHASGRHVLYVTSGWGLDATASVTASALGREPRATPHNAALSCQLAAISNFGRLNFGPPPRPCLGSRGGGGGGGASKQKTQHDSHPRRQRGHDPPNCYFCQLCCPVHHSTPAPHVPDQRPAAPAWLERPLATSLHLLRRGLGAAADLVAGCARPRGGVRLGS